jgi:hypothetical protein
MQQVIGGCCFEQGYSHVVLVTTLMELQGLQPCLEACQQVRSLCCTPTSCRHADNAAFADTAAAMTHAVDMFSHAFTLFQYCVHLAQQGHSNTAAEQVCLQFNNGSGAFGSPCLSV